MSCITKGDTSVLWNGEPLQPLSSGRGLRQGDLMSPYIFVLCLEYLSKGGIRAFKGIGLELELIKELDWN